MVEWECTVLPPPLPPQSPYSGFRSLHILDTQGQHITALLLSSVSSFKDSNLYIRKTCRRSGWKNSWNWMPAQIHTHTHTQQGISMHTALSFFKYFKVRVVNHCWTVTVERQGAGRARVAVVGLVQQPVDVTGQTSGGANGMVPQDVDYVIQSVQTILHLRLKTPGGQSSKFTKRTLNFKPSCPKQQDSTNSSFSD